MPTLNTQPLVGSAALSALITKIAELKQSILNEGLSADEAIRQLVSTLESTLNDNIANDERQQLTIDAMLDILTNINIDDSGEVRARITDKELTTEDLNTLNNADTDTGIFYWARGGNSCTNKPANCNNFGMQMFRTGSSSVVQQLYDQENDIWYVRSYGQDKDTREWRWTDWKVLGS